MQGEFEVEKSSEPWAECRKHVLETSTARSRVPEPTAECGKHAADRGKQSDEQSSKLALALVSFGQSLENMLLMEASTVRSLEEGFLQACKVGDIEAVREVPNTYRAS
jgi:hypothetical protein